MPKRNSQDSQQDMFIRHEGTMQARCEKARKKRDYKLQFQFAYGKDGKSGWIHNHGFHSARDMKDADWNKFNFDFEKLKQHPEFFKKEENQKHNDSRQAQNKLVRFAYGTKKHPGWLYRHGFKSYLDMNPKDKKQFKTDFKIHQKRQLQKVQQKHKENKISHIKNHHEARAKIRLDKDNSNIRAINKRKQMSKSPDPKNEENEHRRRMSSIDPRFSISDPRVLAKGMNVKMHHGHVVRDAQGNPIPGPLVKASQKLGNSHSKFAQFLSALFSHMAEVNDEIMDSKVLNDISPVGLHRNLYEYMQLRKAKRDKQNLKQEDPTTLKELEQNNKHNDSHNKNDIIKRRRANVLHSRQHSGRGLSL